MNKKMIFSVLIVICAVVAGYFLLNSPRSTDMTPEANAPAVSGKLNITAVCESALSYMSFPDGASADAFVAECVEGKHPQVIERYKLEMGLGDGAVI